MGRLSREWRIERDGDEDGRMADRWLVTYADMITLLMILFIVLYALSSKISANNFERLAKSLNTSLTKKKLPADPTKDPFTMDLDERAALEQASEEIKRAIAPFKGRSEVKVDLTSRGLIISLADTAFFDLGSSEIRPEGREPLLKIASAIASQSNAIRVEGHTDDTPPGNGNTNWLIAATRAANVAKLLSDAGKVPAKRFEIVSYGEFKPLFPNDTPEHRAMNRRVDIVVQDEAPTPARTPKPSVDTLAPVFTNPYGGVPAQQYNPGRSNDGGILPNPFGSTY